MPANLPPQYFQAQKRFQRASTPWEKVQALEEMLAVMPHHKGTDHLRAELTGRIARLSEEMEKKGAGRKGPGYYVRKEGAGQVALVGLPNVGKSRLVAAVTDASPEVGDYPFTTKTATPAMMRFENVQIQLVDMPAITDRLAQSWLSSVIRNADLLLIMVDLGTDAVEQAQTTVRELERMRIGVIGWETEAGEGIVHPKKSLLVGNKADLDPSADNYRALRTRYGERLPVVAVSAAHEDGLEALPKAVFYTLDIIRVYTKAPGTKADLTEPVILKSGSTVADLAGGLHKEFLQKLNYAQVWGSGKFEGQRVGRDHILQDGDVVELHA